MDGYFHRRVFLILIFLCMKCEALLSSITQSEDTVLVSSGFTAGRLATALWRNEVFNLNPSHPAIQTNNVRTPEINLTFLPSIQ